MKISLMMILILFPVLSMADFLLEPFADYDYGKYTSTLQNYTPATSNGAYQYTVQGEEYGFRLAGSFKKFFFGWQYNAGILKDKVSKQPDNSTEADGISYRVSMQSMFLGMKGKIYRFWLNYYYDIRMKESSGSLKNTKYNSSSGFGFTIGRKIFDKMSINLGYKFFSIKEIVDPDGVVTAIPGGKYGAMKWQILTLGVSFPFYFGTQ
jgi:hypothetical protein